MNVGESILLAIDSIRVNKLRSFLTLLSISIGVFAIIGTGSLVESINKTVEGEIEALGETTFYVFKQPKIQMGGSSWRKYARRKPINYSLYQDLKANLVNVSLVSATGKSMANTVASDNHETNPDITLVGVDEDYFQIENYSYAEGRGLLQTDILMNRDVAVIGSDVASTLFPNISPIGQMIKIKNQRFDVVGVLEPKGAILGVNADNIVVVPVTHFLKYFASYSEQSLDVAIRAIDKQRMSLAIDETIGLMRSLRNLKPWEENDFEIETNESLSEQFAGLTVYLKWFGFISGGIALIAAGIGIMNIMLVSVKERTREIGIRKAIGAKRHWILTQFIIEAITLCQIGGIMGIFMGLSAGYLFGSLAGAKLGVPTDWIIASVLICTFLGLFFGAYPAWKAAKLDPIDALRYE